MAQQWRRGRSTALTSAMVMGLAVSLLLMELPCSQGRALRGSAATSTGSLIISREVAKFGTTSASLCTDASGQSVGACNLIGDGYIMGSGADLFASARFAQLTVSDVAPPSDGEVAESERGKSPLSFSTDPNIRGFLADHIIKITANTVRFASAKKITGQGQVDLYLCSEADCNTLADLLYVATPGTAPDPSPKLAFGYSRIDGTLVGLPTRYITDASMEGQLQAVAVAGTDADEAEAHRVAWPIPNPQWVDANPVMMPAGAAVRLMNNHAGEVAFDNFNLDLLRIGNYVDRGTGDCVSIITPQHKWMDAMGWNVASGCKAPKKMLVFDSYFVQASVEWPSLASISEAEKSGRDYVFTPLPANTWTATKATWSERNKSFAGLTNSLKMPLSYDQAVAEEVDIFSYGRTLFCDRKHFQSKQTMPAGKTTCYASSHRWASVFYEEDHWFSSLDHVVIGNASVLVWDITEAKLLPADDDGHMKLKGGDWWNGYRYLGAGGDTDTGCNPVGRGLRDLNPLLKLSAMAILPDDQHLPWCSTNPEKFNERHKVGMVRHPKTGKAVDWRDCEAWPALGWGPTGTQADGGTETESLARYLVPAFADVSYHHSVTQRETNFPGQWLSTNDGIGFSRYEYPIPGALEAGITTVLLDARTALAAATDAELSTTDFTYTVPGALLTAALTLTGLIAGYAGRKEIVYMFYNIGVGSRGVDGRGSGGDSSAGSGGQSGGSSGSGASNARWWRRHPLLMSKVLACVTFAFAALTPALLAVVDEYNVRQQNADGSDSSVVWVQADAQGQGAYKIIGAVSMTMNSANNDAAFALLCFTFVVSLVGWAGTCVMVWRVQKQVLTAMRRGGSSAVAALTAAGIDGSGASDSSGKFVKSPAAAAPAPAAGGDARAWPRPVDVVRVPPRWRGLTPAPLASVGGDSGNGDDSGSRGAGAVRSPAGPRFRPQWSRSISLQLGARPTESGPRQRGGPSPAGTAPLIALDLERSQPQL